jgi:hypothetical protein
MAWYDEGQSIPPAMSLFAPGKPNVVAPGLVGHIRDAWSALVGRAKVLVVIGVAPFLADQHVWEPVMASNAPVWYVGREGGDFEGFTKELGARFTQVGADFGAATDSIVRRLLLLP